jgi:hypothetical protein
MTEFLIAVITQCIIGFLGGCALLSLFMAGMGTLAYKWTLDKWFLNMAMGHALFALALIEMVKFLWRTQAN